jgi:hypothetical protein
LFPFRNIFKIYFLTYANKSIQKENTDNIHNKIRKKDITKIQVEKQCQQSPDLNGTGIYEMPYDPAIPLLGIYPKECDSGHYRGTCTPIFISVLLTMAKLRKQPRCPTTDEWIKKMWYLYTMEFYSAMKKNEILSFASKWMELENILSEVSQDQKTKNRSFFLICGL